MRIFFVVGEPPNLARIAAFTRETRRYPSMVPSVVYAGNDHDTRLGDGGFEELAIQPPDFTLGIASGSHAVQTAEVMTRLEPLLEAMRPDLVLVVGDADTTAAAALTASKLEIAVAHVDAGLRSFDRRLPEEINSLVTDAPADFLFVSEDSARRNLLREGIPPAKIHLVGNVTVDALELLRPYWQRSSIFDQLGLEPEQSYGVLTLQCAANVADPVLLMRFLDAFQEIGRHLRRIFPVPPRVKQILQRSLLWPDSGPPVSTQDKGVAYVEPLRYLDLVALLSRARLVLADSGAIQEETTTLAVPCLTIRGTTERPVTVSHGTNQVIGRDPRRIVDHALRTLEKTRTRSRRPPLWDGQAAGRIVNILAAHRKGKRHG